MAWQPIETAPKMRTILLFAVSDVDEHGSVKNWKMATGSWHTGYEDERSKAAGLTPWEWDGHRVKVYELHPTHWMPLPAPPSAGEETHRSSLRETPVNELLEVASAFDDVLGRCQLYGNADRVREHWRNLKNAILRLSASLREQEKDD